MKTAQLAMPAPTEQGLRTWRRAAARAGRPLACDEDFLLGIYVIETHFRPLYRRLAEYAATAVTGLWSLVSGRPIRSWTIGPYQLGLPTILAYYGYPARLHDHTVHIPSLRALASIFSAAALSTGVRILDWRLAPTAREAARHWPDREGMRCRAVGEEFGGRFTYGLILERVVEALHEA